MPCRGETAILLPVGIVRYASLEYGVKRRQKLTADRDQNVHLGLALPDPALEVLSIAGNHSDGEYG